MARKLAPAHRTRDGQPIKTTDVARAPTGTRPRAGDRTPERTRPRLCVRLHAHVRSRACTCEEAED
jgi:hypothetical protein